VDLSYVRQVEASFQYHLNNALLSAHFRLAVDRPEGLPRRGSSGHKN